MNRNSCLVLLAFLAGSPAIANDAPNELASLMHGRFDTHALNPGLAAEDRFVDERIRINAPQLGDFVFYQQINQRENLEVYRQRILVLSISDSGTIRQHAYAIREPEWYVDADPAAFESLTVDDLDAFMPEGCAQVWSKQADGFRGYVDPTRCEIVSSRTGKHRQIESEAHLTRETLSLAERGYDPDSGEQLFGTAEGDFLRLGRVDSPQ